MFRPGAILSLLRVLRDVTNNTKQILPELPRVKSLPDPDFRKGLSLHHVNGEGHCAGIHIFIQQAIELLSLAFVNEELES